MKIVAAIPVYNEEATIEAVVKASLRHTESVIVIDNNSTDRTSDIAIDAGATVYPTMGLGMGAGIATRRAWQIIECGKYYDVMVTLDGDGQHNPYEIPEVVKPILDGEADLVIGSRFCGDYTLPKYRKFGIDIITWLYNMGHREKIADAQSCFRAYSRDVLEKISITEDGFGFSTETLIKARKLGFWIVEVPISCIYHEDRKANSTLNPVRHGLEVAWKTVKWRLKLWA